MFARSGRPRAGEVLLWVLCLLALQGAAGLLQSLLSPAMEFFRTKSKVVSGTAETTVSLALYTAVAAPITEELLFRGAVLRSLQPYGKRFAIFCSALLFGLVHQNLTQTPFAFGFGLLAGYVAVEYSILWSMSLHILNNAVLALGLDALLRPLSGTWYWLAIRGALFLLPLAVCLVLALVFRKKLAARRGARPHRPEMAAAVFPHARLDHFSGPELRVHHPKFLRAGGLDGISRLRLSRFCCKICESIIAQLHLRPSPVVRCCPR